jgi:hypothetical protein
MRIDRNELKEVLLSLSIGEIEEIQAEKRIIKIIKEPNRKLSFIIASIAVWCKLLSPIFVFAINAVTAIIAFWVLYFIFFKVAV